MERKDYNNFVKSMKLSHHWYCADDSLASELRYGIFVPSNELIVELMEGKAYFLLVEVINSCEYTKNANLLYVLTEFVLAKWKEYQRTGKEDFIADDLKMCLQISLRTLYRLFKSGIIAYGEKTISRIIEDYKDNIDLEECKPALEALLKSYLYYNKELSDETREFMDEEEARLTNIREIKENYERKYMHSYDIAEEDSNKVNFITSALKEGMITIESDGTIKSPFIDEENDYQLDPDLTFMLDEKIQACMIKESIDEGLVRVIEGLDFLKSEKPIVKNL